MVCFSSSVNVCEFMFVLFSHEVARLPRRPPRDIVAAQQVSIPSDPCSTAKHRAKDAGESELDYRVDDTLILQRVCR